MRTLTLCAVLSCLLTVVLPGALFAADSSAAMLHTNGPAWLNGSNVPKTSAIFSGDLVQTRSDSVANINAPGTSVLVLSDSLVQYQGSTVKLEQGSVNLATSKNKTAQLGGLQVVPAAAAWTEFEVRDTDGSVKIIARKGDLTLTDARGTTTLPQGQETTRDETSANGKKKRDRNMGGAVPAAGGGILDSPPAIYTGLAASAVLTGWALMQGDDPMSPKSL
jgi:hypothetical protein